MMDKERMLKLKDAYLQLIVDLAFDYDGYSKAEDLMVLIDELSSYAKLALENNDTAAIYESHSFDGKQTQSNILMEDI